MLRAKNEDMLEVFNNQAYKRYFMSLNVNEKNQDTHRTHSFERDL